MTRHRLGRLAIWAIRVVVGLAVAGLLGCGAARSLSSSPGTAAPSAPAAVSAGATDLNSVLQAVHASPDGAYAVEQTSQCPGMSHIGSFFVVTNTTNRFQVDGQRAATIAYMHSKSNRELVYTCLGNKFGMTTAQEHTLAGCVEPKALAAYEKSGHLIPSEAQIIAALKTTLLTYVPQCYTTATGRALTPPSTASPSPSTSNGA